MAKFKQIREAAKYNPYAIGMAAAKKAAGLGSAPAQDLPKSIITKGHEIAKKIKANEEYDADLAELNESAGDKLLQAAREYKQGSHEYHKGMIKYHDHMADVHYGTPKGNEHEENIRHHRSELAKLKEGWIDPAELKKTGPGYAKGMLKPELEKGFPAPGVRTGVGAPKGTSTMPKDKKKAAGQPAGAMGEEAEQVDEISKDLALRYLDKAPKSARIHGMISTDYRNASERKRNPGLKRALDNLSKKYKSKAWRREDGIKRAISKIAGDK